MGTPVAVQGCTFKASVSPSSGTVSGGSVTAVSLPSQDISVNGKGVFFDKIDVLISNLVYTPLVPPAGATSPSSSTQVPANTSISGTAADILEGDVMTGKKAVLKGDSGTVSVQFVFPISMFPYTTPVSADVTVEVDDPGQTDVEAS